MIVLPSPSGAAHPIQSGVRLGNRHPAKTQSSPYAQEGWSFSGTALPLNCAVPVALPGRRPWKTGPRNEVERSTSGPLATLPV